jgi:hypothetical protein
MENNQEHITKEYINLGEKIKKLSPKTKKILLSAFWIIVILIAFINPFFSLGLVFIFFGIRSAIKHLTFMKKFAENNGLKYEFSISAKKLTGRLFSISGNESTMNVLSGTFENIPIKIFNYQYTIGSGKNSRTYHFTVSEIEIKETKFPYILLKSNLMPYYNSYDLFGKKNDVEMSLEPEYKKNYKLFTTLGYEIEVFQIFSKELLDFLKETGSHFSIEFSENKIYIYDDKLIRSEKELSTLFDLTKRIIEKIAPFLHRMSDDFSALHDYYQK